MHYFGKLEGGRGCGGFVGGARYGRQSRKGLSESVVFNTNERRHKREYHKRRCKSR